MMEAVFKMLGLSKTGGERWTRRRMQISFSARDGNPRPGVKIEFEDTKEEMFIAADDFWRLMRMYDNLCLPVMNEPSILNTTDFEQEIQARNDAAWKTLNPDKYK